MTEIVGKRRKTDDILYVSIDTEKLGQIFSQPLVAIGIYCGDENGKYLSHKGIYLKPVEQVNGGTKYVLVSNDTNRVSLNAIALTHEPEELCMKEFWSKPDNQKTLAFIQSRALPLELALDQFLHYYDDELTKMFPDRKRVLICDNPCFDLGAIDYHLLVTQKRAIGIKNSFDGSSYYSCVDPSADNLPYEWFKKIKESARAITAVSIPSGDPEFEREHLPVRDAAENYYLYLEQKRVLKNLYEKGVFES